MLSLHGLLYFPKEDHALTERNNGFSCSKNHNRLIATSFCMI